MASDPDPRAPLGADVRRQGRKGLLEDDPVLAQSIGVRNAYVDRLNLLQVELLRRHRGGERSVGPGLEITINGMRKTGGNLLGPFMVEPPTLLKKAV